MTIITYGAALYAIAGAAYAFLLVLLLLSQRRSTTSIVLAGACAMTAVSAIAVAAGFGGPSGPAGVVAELAGSGSWCVFIFHLLRRRIAADRWLFVLFCCVGILIGISVLGFTLLQPTSSRNLPLIGELAARLGLAIFGVLLTENLYRNTAPESRWHINILCVALGGLFCYGVILYADALLFRRVSPLLWGGRAIVMTVATPLIAVAVARNRDWVVDIHVSRSVVFHTATLVASGIFLLALAITGEVLRSLNPGWGQLVQVALVVSGVAALAVLITSGSARSRLRHILLDNFFSHRYDYRQEWLKNIELLSTDANRVSVQSRVINAVAGIADSPAGVLWVRDLEGTAFLWAGSWNRPAIAASEPADSAFVALFRGAKWIIEVDQAAVRPAWLAEVEGAWLVVPLSQRNELIGFVVLTNPRAPLKLDRETFDLLRIVGRQAATHVAEQRYAQALAESRELHAYGKRFAFAIHDMKNVAGQLTMILQNARRHQDDPAFQEDVLATVRSAVDRLNRLLERLRAPDSWPREELVAPIDIIREEVTAIRRTHGILIKVDDDGGAAAIAMDGGAFRSVIRHLCENAVEASPDGVQLRLSHDALRLRIDVIDKGAGMTPEFVRDKLFQPFGSTKRDGLGIGAYQAREFLREAGGDLIVKSGARLGTTMSIVLPCITSILESRFGVPAEKANG
jgi:putative PEP-CTERM system histidine kinase